MVATATAKRFVPLSAVSAGVKDVREVVDGARRLLGEQGRGTILFLDEVHRFNRSQQDALLPSVEEGLLVLIGATTENPFFEVNAPLLSRSTLWRLEPLAASTSWPRWWPAASRPRGRPPSRTPWRPWSVWPTATPGPSSPPWRWPWPWPATAPVTLGDVERARHSRLQHYGEDDHYDQVSAFIKSMRGSDPDAGLYWLARMLEAGEDARFIARRLVILASEDIGEADPLALVVADAAARAVEFVGPARSPAQPGPGRRPPGLRAQVQPGHRGPRSGPARCAGGPQGDVPAHLRDAHYRSAAIHRPRRGLRLPPRPTRTPGSTSSTGPTSWPGHRYYEPSDRGHEAVVADRLRRWRARVGDAEPGRGARRHPGSPRTVGLTSTRAATRRNRSDCRP